ncbi:MAG: LrgB family protein [Helicobacteraceae bacterium]|jgi:predicted murein hydrolase (TIGR00659 family)|nr:LrgB family protein [Helicobacteraceae bacterium]
MMEAFLVTPFFGLGLTVIAGLSGLYIKRNIAWKLFNPMLFSMLLIIGLLLISSVPYAHYALGGDLILKMLGPITVVLAVPLYQHHEKLKKHAVAIFLGVVLGSLSALVSVYLFSLMAGLDMTLLKSLLPRSITTPIGIAASEMIEGLVGLTVVSIVITGTFGAIVAEWVFKRLKITEPIAKGVALGTSAHAIGTGRAFEYGTLEGAMSGLSIAIAGVSTILWLFLFQFLGFI